MNVYFIKSGQGIKIGVTSDINKRLKALQTANQTKLELLHYIIVSEKDAYVIESKIHGLFHSNHLVGEWYKINPMIVDFIENIKINGWESHFKWLETCYRSAYESQ